jgi:AraC-like DNA-binding protein
MMSCTGSDGPKDDTGLSQDATFDHAMGVADSLYNCMQFRDAYKLYLQLLDNEEVEADSEKKLRVLDALCNSSELSGNKVEQHKWLQQMIDLGKQTGSDYYLSLACITMGQNLFYEGDREKGIYRINEGIDLMAKTDRENTDHLIHGYLNMLASMYGAVKDYDHALQTNERNLQLTIDGTRWGAAPAQQLIDRRMALAKKASVLAQMGRSASGSLQARYYQQADSAYAAWKAIEYEGNHTRDYFIVDYMKKRGRYQEAATIYNGLIERIRQQGDTLGEMMNTTKWGLAEVYRKMGHCSQAADLYEQVLEIQDTLKSRKARNSAQELAAIYHEKEQEQTIMQQQAENTRQRYLLFIVLAVLVGVIVLAVVIIRKNRIISRKNLSLAAQITEAMTYKEKYMQEKLKFDKPASTSDVTDLDTLSDEQLFQYINDVIVRERLFLDSHFDRQTIMDRFQLSKERVGAAFSKGSQYAKLTDYTQELRLEYSTLLMSTNPEKSVSQIALDCGFSSQAYYSRCFRQRFGMSPTEFRSSASQES